MPIIVNLHIYVTVNNFMQFLEGATFYPPPPPVVSPSLRYSLLWLLFRQWQRLTPTRRRCVGTYRLRYYFADSFQRRVNTRHFMKPVGVRRFLVSEEFCSTYLSVARFSFLWVGVAGCGAELNYNC